VQGGGEGRGRARLENTISDRIGMKITNSCENRREGFMTMKFKRSQPNDIYQDIKLKRRSSGEKKHPRSS
jgi:hypothetical protein